MLNSAPWAGRTIEHHNEDADMKHISLTKPARVPQGYSVTVLAEDGRTPIASSLPKATRNGAVIGAWTLANDIRAARL